MSVLKELIAVLRTVTTLLVVTLAPAMLAIALMPMDLIVMVRLTLSDDFTPASYSYIALDPPVLFRPYKLFFFSTDIDECAEQLDECQQICNNTIGSYVCDCHIGYALNSDGRTCRGKDYKR